MRLPQLVVVSIMVCLLAATVTAASEKTTIEFWWGESAETENMLELVAMFEETHPWIEVELVDQGYMGGGSGLDKVKTAIAGGVPPDIVWMDATQILPGAIVDGLYLPLDEVVDRGFLQTIPWLPAPEKYVTDRGRIYGLQFRTDARGLYFNQDLFENAGLNSEVGPADIEELDLYTAKLTEINPDGTLKQLGFAPRGNNFGGGLGWLWVFGGTIYNPETKRPTLTGNPAHLRALEWIASYADRYGPIASGGSNPFMDNQVAMIVQSTTWLNQFPERAPNLRWWVSHIPYPPQGRMTTMSGGFGPVIPRGARNLEAAGEFIKFLAQKETQIEWYRRTRGIPARADALQTLLETEEIIDPRERTMVGALPSGEAYPPLFAGVVRPEFQTNLDRMRRREITPQQALENTQRAVEPIFRELFGE